MPSIPDQYLRGDFAAAERTLIDIFSASASAHPEAACLDDGERVLSYSEVWASVLAAAEWMAEQGIRPGDRVGIHMSSGRVDLYLAILSTLAAGAAYVPVDVDDPAERAELVFGQAEVAAVFTDDGLVMTEDRAPAGHRLPVTGDDCWVIFTSGTTGLPKGVAVSHRSAAAFVDAESRMFLRDRPLGPGDRVLAGLSIAFDASCEEMWLAWAHGACLVPAPRSVVKSGLDLGPWIARRGVTVISTVPTLASMWPDASLAGVRLVILGGEACPPELAAKLVAADREVWNTYGPTEATVVACAAPLTGAGEVAIGLPLDGWDLAVVDGDGQPVDFGGSGELVIGGVGLARYLDPVKDAEKYAPMPSLGWERAYRSGDVVRLEPEGLFFGGRVDDQVKVGGRRLELGEVDTAVSALPGVVAGAAAIRKTDAGQSLLVAYLVAEDPEEFDLAAAAMELREHLPAGVVPRLALVDELPTRTSGKVDRDALPWPLTSTSAEDSELDDTDAWVAEMWSAALGADVSGVDEDFFALGGGSLAAAHVVTRVRDRYPEVTVGDLYDRPRLGDFSRFLDSLDPVADVSARDVRPVGTGTQLVQLASLLPLVTMTGLQWTTWLGWANNLGGLAGWSWAQEIPWWVLALMTVLFLLPAGRMVLAIGVSRALTAGITPGTYRRGGGVHLRIWAAERFTEQSGAVGLGLAGWMTTYARALGARIGRGVDLHSLPPVTGLLEIGDFASVEPEVDLAGYWIDGDEVHVGAITIGPGAVVTTRSTLQPGTEVGKDTLVEPGSAVFGSLKSGKRYAGSPARKRGKRPSSWPRKVPPKHLGWKLTYRLTALALGGLPVAAVAAGFALIGWGVRDTASLPQTIALAAAWSIPAVALALALFAGVTFVAIRLLAVGLREGFHPVHSRIAWQAWATERLMDSARTWLYPVYAAMLTPAWLRLLGADIGKNVEASTVLLIPSLTTVREGAFLADDTMVASYELGGGWMHIDQVQIGKRAFLGNSGIASAGRKVPKYGLVAVLSSAPQKAKKGTSWLGSPPQKLPRTVSDASNDRTYEPPRKLKLARGAWETLRLVPVWLSFALLVGVFLTLQQVVGTAGYALAAGLSGLVFAGAGVIALLTTVAAKWLLVGKITAGDRPLWSSFVWRNELADAFVELLGAPWVARPTTGTPVLTGYLRMLGSRIGRGVWCESYWLPEADLISIGDGATVNRGCVVQTHLFHDRIMQLDTVELDEGATLGTHCVALPASSVGAGTTVGPGSLVMRGDRITPGTRWQGNPIAPWKG